MASFLTNPTRQWADLLGYDTNGALKLMVEVKARVRPDAWQLARQWLEKASATEAALYCMFITPEFIALRLPADRRPGHVRVVGELPFSLIKNAEAKTQRVADFLVETRMSLDLAIDTQRVPLHRLDPQGLTRTVDSWLETCLWMERRALENQPFQAWLVESGLYEVLVNGRIASSAGSGYAYALAS